MFIFKFSKNSLHTDDRYRTGWFWSFLASGSGDACKGFMHKPILTEVFTGYSVIIQ